MKRITPILGTLENLRVDFIAGTLGLGGAERQLYYMAKVLTEAGGRVRVLSLSSGEAYQEDISKLGIPVIYVGKSSSRMLRLYNIISEVKKDPPMIIHSVHFYTNIYAAVAARIIKAKEIGAIRSNLFYEVNGLSFLGRWSLRYPRFLAANSRKAVENAAAFGTRPESVSLVENAVDTELFHPPDIKTCSSGGSGFPVSIIWAGRLERYKRIDIFLRVLAEVHRLTPPVRGMIVGDGPLRKSLEDLSRKLNLGPESVEFAGIVKDMPSVYQKADILVLTSDFEGMPNVILEAMACGLPVVATDAGAVPDIVDHGLAGYVVPIGDIKGLVYYLSTLIHNSTLCREMGMKARASVEKRFSLRLLQKRLFRLYRRVLTPPRGVQIRP